MTDTATETRCPACQTVFAVEAEDLDRAGGRVRCGDCMQVFDARAHALHRSVKAADGEHPEHDAPGAGHEADDALADDTDGAAAGDAGDAGDAGSVEIGGIGDDQAEEIDDSPFTATNWFIVDEAGELAPMEGATNDETGGAGIAPDVEDSGAFRFGDDTPPDTLRAELAALVGDDVDDIEDVEAIELSQEEDTSAAVTDLAAEAPRADDDAPASSETRDTPAGDVDMPPRTTARTDASQAGARQGDGDGQDDDWDDLLGELDEEFDARLDALQPDDVTETEAADPAPHAEHAEAIPEPESELELEQAEAGPESEHAGAMAQYEPEHGPADVAAPPVEELPPGTGGPDPSAPLDFELVETDEAGRATSLDLDLTRATGETKAPDLELIDDEMPASDIARVDLGLSGEAAGPAEPDLVLEPERADTGADAATAQTDDDEPVSVPAAAAGDAEDFNAAALDDMMDALRLLDEEPAPDESDAVADDHDAESDAAATAEAATTDEDARADEADGDATRDDEAQHEPPAEAGRAQGAAQDTGKTAVGEDTINAMADGERGEVIVLGGEAEAAPAASLAEAVADVDEDDDPSFAESMIVSPELAPKPRRTGLWLTLSALAALGLALQAVHTWRGTLATMPYWQDALPRIYGTLGVELAPEWDIRPWCVETSGALASEAGLDIEAIFSNRGDTALPPPELKVRIVDAYSNTLAATVISPRDYLEGASAATRVAPGERIAALARLDYNEPRLDGYEVALCYPNADGTLRCGTGCTDGD